MYETVDGSGAPLWYALSGTYRSMAAGLNSETGGQLALDGVDDVVAIIFAPGPEVNEQSRGAESQYDKAAYLDDCNAVAVNAYVSRKCTPDDDVQFNDVVIAITRSELMSHVEAMVAGEVASALNDYYLDSDADGDQDPDTQGYPWLARFDDVYAVPPSELDPRPFIGTVGVRAGLLPIIQSGVEFNADFLADWNIPASGTATPSNGTSPPSEACVRSNVCLETFQAPTPWGMMNINYAFNTSIDGSDGGEWSQGACEFGDAGLITCRATRNFVLAPPSNRAQRRDYELSFYVNLDENSELSAPTQESLRTVTIDQAGAWSGAPASIAVTDYDMSSGNPEGVLLGTRTLTFNSLASADSLRLANIPFDLEVSTESTVDRSVSPGQLPKWFHANEWHRLIAVQYASAAEPEAANRDCTSNQDCLTVSIQRPGDSAVSTVPEVYGAVLSAGSPLAGQNRTVEIPTRDAYFEGANLSGEPALNADIQQPSAEFNDRVSVLSPP
jgi:hypothetical protein